MSAQPPHFNQLETLDGEVTPTAGAAADSATNNPTQESSNAGGAAYATNVVVPFVDTPSLTGAVNQHDSKAEPQQSVRFGAVQFESMSTTSSGADDEDDMMSELPPGKSSRNVRKSGSGRLMLPAWTSMREPEERRMEKRVVAMSFMRRKLPPRPQHTIQWRFSRFLKRPRRNPGGLLGLLGPTQDVGSLSDSELLLEDFARRHGAQPSQQPTRGPGAASAAELGPKMLHNILKDIREPHHVALGKIVVNMLQCLGYAFVASLLPVFIFWLFSFTFLPTVRSWRADGHTIISDNPIEAAVFGEPFHALSASLVVQNVVWLVFVCPVMCCLFKLCGHLYFIYEPRHMKDVLRNGGAWVGCMAIMQFACFATMAAGKVRVPRLVWMSLIFVFLFVGAWVGSGVVSREFKDPSARKYFVRHTIIANVVCYVYSIVGPWLFYRSGRAVQLAMLLGLHPLMEYTFFFMFLTDSTRMTSAKNRMLWVMCLHYTNILRLFETFLMLTFDDATNTVLSLVCSKTLQVILRIYSNGIYRLVHTRVLRRKHLDWGTFFGEKRFVSFSLDYDRAVFIADVACIVVSSGCNYILRFRGQTDAGEVAWRMLGAILIDMVKDVVVLYVLLQLGADWFHAFQTRAKRYTHAVILAVNASAVMFLFYMYSFLAANAEP